MSKNKIIRIIVCAFILVNMMLNASSAIEAIQMPEDNINLKIENLTRGTKVYLLLSENLLKYNMEKYISNNLNNPYIIEAEQAEELQKYLNNKDYVGYVNYYKEFGFNQENDNEVELRHYCIAMSDEAEVIGKLEYNNINYVQIRIHLNDQNEFKVIFKDYLVNYNSLDTMFMIDDYGSITYIKTDTAGYITSQENSNIRECNVTHIHCDIEEYNSIEKTTNIVYLIILIILIIIAIVILTLLIKRYKKKKAEKEARKFWKKKLTKEEKKEQKKQIKELKKLNRMTKKKKR